MDNKQFFQLVCTAIEDEIRSHSTLTFYINLVDGVVSAGLKSSKRRKRGFGSDVMYYYRNIKPPTVGSVSVGPMSVMGYQRERMSDNFYGVVSVGGSAPPRFPIHRENVSSVPFESMRDTSHIGEISCQAM